MSDAVPSFEDAILLRNVQNAVAPQIRRATLEAATAAVTVDRAATHGGVEDTFGRIAALWSAYLGVPVSPVDASMLLALLKVARAKGNPGHADNFVDLAGYAACGAELAGARP